MPTEEAVRIALRTQQIIAYESGVTNVIDPLGGSYYVEWLTNEIESQAEKYIKKIDAMGGMVKAIEQGYIQREIVESAYRYQKEVEEGKRVVVGVNKFVIEEPIQIRLLKVRPEVEKAQIERVREVRSSRDDQRAKRALKSLREAAESGENVMPTVLQAVKAYCTIGEMCDVLREVYGEYQAPTIY